MLDELKISLPLYEGPLDLLLDLIRRQKLDIYDIPIAKVTEQYLDVPPFDGGNERGYGFGVSPDCRSTDLHQIADAPAAGSGRLAGRAGRSAGRAGAPAAGIREIQECRADALSARDDRECVVVQSRAMSDGSRRAGTRTECHVSTISCSRFAMLSSAPNSVRPMEVSRDEFSVEQMMAYLFEKIVSAPGAVALTDDLAGNHLSSRVDHSVSSRFWS